MHEMDSFLHTQQSQPSILLRGLYLKPLAGIAHDKLNRILRSCHLHCESTYTAMLDRIMQCFLGDTEKTEGRVLRQMCRRVLFKKLNVDVALLGELFAEPPDRCDDPKVVELR